MSNIINLSSKLTPKPQPEPTIVIMQLIPQLVQRLRAKQQAFHEKRRRSAKRLLAIVRGAPRVLKGPPAVIGYLGDFGQTEVLCANEEFS